MRHVHLILLSLGYLFPLVATSCAPTGSAGYLRRTNSEANDHIMLVRENPATFGFRRLDALAGYYPDLRFFIQRDGLPEFLAEIDKEENRYLILYYPASRQAFACRSGSGNSHQVEFSGPHPITDNELKTLRKLEAGITPGAP